MKNAAMIDRYRWWEMVLLYCGIALFLIFVLAPFIEGFLVSLKPLTHLFSSPYRFWPEEGSFDAYVTMWKPVPYLGRYIFNSIFISTVITAIVLVLVVPAAYAFARFEFPGRGSILGAFLAVNMFSGAVLLIPLYRLLRGARAAQYLLLDDRARRGLPDPDRHLAAAHLHAAHSARAGRGRLGRRGQSLLHLPPGHPAPGHAGHLRGRDRDLHRRLCAAIHLRSDLQRKAGVHATSRRAIRLLRPRAGGVESN